MFSRLCGVLLSAMMLLCAACGQSETSVSKESAPVREITVASDWAPIPNRIASVTDQNQDQEIQDFFKLKIKRCLHVFGSKKAAALRAEFGGKLVMASYDTSLMALRTSEQSLPQLQESSGGQLIVLYGENAQYTGPMEPALFIYREEFSAVFIPAVSMSEPWFCAAVLHELSHASEHRKRGSVRAPQSMEENFMEEVRMHDMEREILDVLTRNAYVPALKEFLKGTQDTSLQAVIDGLLKGRYPPELAPVMGLFPPGNNEENTIKFAQIAIDLAFVSVEQKGGTDEDKLAAYIEQRNRVSG